MCSSRVRLVRSLIVFAALAAATACAESTTAPTPLDHLVTLAPGQTAFVDGAGVQVRFDGVRGDARCPADAFCVAGGDAVVMVAVVDEGRVSTYELHTGPLTPATHGDLTLSIERLDPYPFSSRAIEPEDYRLTLRVTR